MTVDNDSVGFNSATQRWYAKRDGRDLGGPIVRETVARFDASAAPAAADDVGASALESALVAAIAEAAAKPDSPRRTAMLRELSKQLAACAVPKQTTPSKPTAATSKASAQAAHDAEIPVLDSATQVRSVARFDASDGDPEIAAILAAVNALEVLEPTSDDAETVRRANEIIALGVRMTARVAALRTEAAASDARMKAPVRTTGGVMKSPISTAADKWTTTEDAAASLRADLFVRGRAPIAPDAGGEPRSDADAIAARARRELEISSAAHAETQAQRSHPTPEQLAARRSDASERADEATRTLVARAARDAAFTATSGR